MLNLDGKFCSQSILLLVIDSNFYAWLCVHALYSIYAKANAIFFLLFLWYLQYHISYNIHLDICCSSSWVICSVLWFRCLCLEFSFSCVCVAESKHILTLNQRALITVSSNIKTIKWKNGNSEIIHCLVWKVFEKIICPRKLFWYYS